MHLKREKVSKNWPIPRKGTKYVVRPRGNLKREIPILIVLRDMLKITQDRKETKKVLNSKFILLNNKIIKDDRRGVGLFDVINIVPEKKYYQVILTKEKKFDIEPIKEDESKYKISKIIGKKTLKGKKEQLNLSDGNNFVSNIKCRVNDSVLVNLKDKKIEKCLVLKEKAKVIIFSGKHFGERGFVENMDTKNKMAELNVNGKKMIILIKHIMVTE